MNRIFWIEPPFAHTNGETGMEILAAALSHNSALDYALASHEVEPLRISGVALDTKRRGDDVWTVTEIVAQRIIDGPLGIVDYDNCTDVRMFKVEER